LLEFILIILDYTEGCGLILSFVVHTAFPYFVYLFLRTFIYRYCFGENIF